MKSKNWYYWIAALFLFASNAHGRELHYPPQGGPQVETPTSKPGGRSNIPLIVCSSVFVAVIVAAVIHHHRVKRANRPAIVYHPFKGDTCNARNANTR